MSISELIDRLNKAERALRYTVSAISEVRGSGSPLSELEKDIDERCREALRMKPRPAHIDDENEKDAAASGCPMLD